MKRWKSITGRLLITTLGIAVIICSAIVLVMASFMSSLTDKIMLELLQPTAKAAAQSVEGNLHVMAENLFMICDNSIISSPSASAQEKREVMETAESGVEFLWIGLYGLDGALITGSSECPGSISGRELAGMLAETDNLVIESTSVSVNGALELAMGIPVSDGSGSESYCYLVGSYKYDALNDVLSNINIGENGAAFIIDSDGVFVVHRDIGKVYSREHISDSLGNDKSSLDTIELMQSRQSGSSILRGPDGRVFISYAPIRGTLWSLGIETPRSDFISAVRQAVLTSVGITLFVLILSVLAFELVLKKILTSPLHIITNNASKLAQGQFESRLPPSLTLRDDEIGQLGAAFATMSDSVQNVIGDIKRLTTKTRIGELGARADSSKHQGSYGLIMAGINSTLDVICSHLDAMPSALALFNEEKEPIFLNNAMVELLKRHSGDGDAVALSSMLMAVVDPIALGDDAAMIFSPESESGCTHEFDVTLAGCDGNEYSYSLILRKVSSDPDPTLETVRRASCVMFILQDVTMLTRAKIDAEAASRAKGDFLSNMSHEMRTPLNAIIGMTSIAKTTGDIERKDYCLEKIEYASAHLLGVINDILDMSKIEANKLELYFEEFSFEEMLRKVVNVINFRVDEKRQDLAVHIDREIPDSLIGDDQRLAQVITNLLSNAIKFTPENGFIRLGTRLLSEEDGMCIIQIEVVDSGIGIDQEQQKRLFTSFEQAESSTSRKFGGTGLGLAISKRIVEMMGGRIWVESEPDQGSTFSFTVRMQRGWVDRRGNLGDEVNWETIHVLAIDDSAEVLEYIDELMFRLDIKCDTANGAEEAFRLIDENGPYDIYFIDLKMSGGGGIEITRRIKEISGGKAAVIMISSMEWNDIEDEARSAGVDRFLSKPLFPSSLADCISEIVGGPRLKPERDQEYADGCFEGKRILLAEDVEINREILIALLEPTLIIIDSAENGAQAVKIFSEAPEKYDMILMDVQMPEMDGYEATRRIRALDNPHAGRVSIVAMTANVFKEDIEKCLASGMDDHLGKPLDFDQVMRKLHRYLLEKSPY